MLLSRGTTMGLGAEETNDFDADDENASISYHSLPILLIILFRHHVLDLNFLCSHAPIPPRLSYVRVCKTGVLGEFVVDDFDKIRIGPWTYYTVVGTVFAKLEEEE
ncbi:hypothetical protein RJT34_25176 [Clitoria ternatea]|uniref:Uncharacterized protein n=1 Tax=Clitoria ternatea TaxID=43366 RepID=A0AAN9FRD4_CLITE